MYRGSILPLKIFSFKKKRKEYTLSSSVTTFVEITIFRLGEFLCATTYSVGRDNLKRPLMIYVKKIGVWEWALSLPVSQWRVGENFSITLTIFGLELSTIYLLASRHHAREIDRVWRSFIGYGWISGVLCGESVSE